MCLIYIYISFYMYRVTIDTIFVLFMFNASFPWSLVATTTLQQVTRCWRSDGAGGAVWTRTCLIKRGLAETWRSHFIDLHLEKLHVIICHGDFEWPKVCKKYAMLKLSIKDGSKQCFVMCKHGDYGDMVYNLPTRRNKQLNLYNQQKWWLENPKNGIKRKLSGFQLKWL